MNMFKQGPKISVNADILRGVIQKIKLKPANCFTLTGTEELPDLYEWCLAYSEKRALPLLKFNFEGLTDFETSILHELSRIPIGETRSYKDLAIKVQRPNAYRAVGGACGKNPFPLLIPCHRVLTSDGKIGGFSQGLDLKCRLLDFEFMNNYRSF